MAVPKAPGPAKHNKLWLRKYGPSTARTILVLVPGSPSGQATFSAFATELVQLVPGLGVWTIDRRGNAFEDTFGFEMNNPTAALGYYTTLVPIQGHQFSPVQDSQAPFVRKWGLKVEANDVHRVVVAARAGGRRRVVLGGHSMMGASFVSGVRRVGLLRPRRLQGSRRPCPHRRGPARDVEERRAGNVLLAAVQHRRPDENAASQRSTVHRRSRSPAHRSASRSGSWA